MIWSGKERRKSVRVQIRVTIHVQKAGQPRYYEALSRDLSVAGARLLLYQSLPHCTPIYLEFRLPGGLQKIYCPAHVAWSHKTPTSLLPDRENAYLMGVEFLRPSRQTRRQLRAFIKDRTRPA